MPVCGVDQNFGESELVLLSRGVPEGVTVDFLTVL